MKTSKNTFGLFFFIKKDKADKVNRVPIYARVTVDGKRADVSLKQSIELIAWDSKKGKPKSRKVNKYLEQVRANIVSCYQDMVIQKRLITAEAIRNKFLGVDRKEFTLNKLIEQHRIIETGKLSTGTLANYVATEKYLQNFVREKHHVSDLFLSEIKANFITDFAAYLTYCNPLKKNCKLDVNGIAKHMERLKKFMRFATRLGWIDVDPFIAYSITREKVEIDFLSQTELDRLKGLELSDERLRLTRDLFVFSCYTGLSYCDVMQLTRENLPTIDSEIWLNTTRQKTDNPVRYPMLTQAIEMVEKYNSGTDKVFPYLSNQKANKYLKQLAKMCDIKKNVTFHVARHTFATTITLTNGVPIESVSKMLGHSNIMTTQIYAKVVQDKLKTDMTALKAKLNNTKPEAITPEFLEMLKIVYSKVTGNNKQGSAMELISEIHYKLAS